MTCPRFVEVNGKLEPPSYEIQENDQIEVRNYYTVAQLAEFMDVEVDQEQEILVNNRLENMDAQVYENFSVDWTVLSFRTTAEDVANETAEKDASVAEGTESSQASQIVDASMDAPDVQDQETLEPAGSENEEVDAAPEPEPEPVDLAVFVNGDIIVLRGKPEYVFIDVFDYIDFDLSDSRGRAIITKVNDVNAVYTQTLHEGDEIVIGWKE